MGRNSVAQAHKRLIEKQPVKELWPYLSEADSYLEALFRDAEAVATPETRLLLAVLEDGLRSVQHWKYFKRRRQKDWPQRAFHILEAMYYDLEWLFGPSIPYLYDFETICAHFDLLDPDGIRCEMMREMKWTEEDVSRISRSLAVWIKRHSRHMPTICVKVEPRKKVTHGSELSHAH